MSNHTNAHFMLDLCLIVFPSMSKAFKARGSNLRHFRSIIDHSEDFLVTDEIPCVNALKIRPS